MPLKMKSSIKAGCSKAPLKNSHQPLLCIASNNSRSTLPPLKTIAVTLPSSSIFLCKVAANATAPPGSTTIFRYRKAHRMASYTSASETVNTSEANSLFIEKVSSPGISASKASQIDFLSVSFLILLLALKDSCVSLKYLGSTR